MNPPKTKEGLMHSLVRKKNNKKKSKTEVQPRKMGILR